MSDELVIPIKVQLLLRDPNETKQPGTLLISDEKFKTLIDKIEIAENGLDAFLFLKDFIQRTYKNTHLIDAKTFTATLQPTKPRHTGVGVSKYFRNMIVRIELRDAIKGYLSERSKLTSALQPV